MEIINQIATEIMQMINDIIPYGDYSYKEKIISKRDIDKLIKLIERRYLK